MYSLYPNSFVGAVALGGPFWGGEILRGVEGAAPYNEMLTIVSLSQRIVNRHGLLLIIGTD